MKKITKRDLLVTLLIFVAAIGLRTLAVYQIAGTAAAVYNPSPATDMFTYWKLSGDILAGNFHGEFYYQPFYYAMWLPGLRMLWNSITTVIIAQTLLGGLTVLLAARCAYCAAGRTAGWIAGILTALCAPLLLYTPFLDIANVQAFFLAAIAFSGVRLYRRGGIESYLGLCVATALAILSRGNVWFAVPGIIVLFFAVWKWRTALAAALGLLVIVVAFQLPFAVQNTIERGTPTGASTAAGQVLALGNTPEAPPGGRNFDSGAGPMEYPPSFQLWMDHAPERSVALQMWDWFRSEPLAFCELQFRKLLLFWDRRDIPNNVSMRGEGGESFVVHLEWTTGVILVLALAGLLAGARRAWKKRRADWWFLAYLIVGYWAATAAFYNLSRFRDPILPVAAVLAAQFTVTAYRRFKLNRRGFYLSSIPPLMIAVFVVYQGFDVYTIYCEAAVMRTARPSGVRCGNMVLDNGPLSFGGWTRFEPGGRDLIEKRFAGVSGPAELELTIWSETSGEIKLFIDGFGRRFALVKGENRIRFPVEDASKIELTVERLPGCLVLDRQRDYGRTLINSKPAGGELVARLHLPR
ncbi:MAG: ArnT family glycosyltransferase [Victivallaceae bacterium]|nr:hypothetical protein [Victivallaceae bacterium]